MRAGGSLSVPSEGGLVLLEARGTVVRGRRPGVVGVMVDCRLVVVTGEGGGRGEGRGGEGREEGGGEGLT